MHAPPPAVGCRRTLSASCPGTAPRRASTARLASPARGCPAARRLTLVRYCGRTFSAQELELIRSLMAEHPGHHRLALSRLVCERLDWRRPNGGLKDMSCRVALLRMHRDLGYTPLAGAQLRYLVLSGPQVLAVLGFAACAWKVAPRDRFIGWSAAQREARLPLVVNNARFLLPCRQRRANPRPRQTRCWIHVGQTQGRGKLDVHNQHALPKKDIWLYPLRRDFRRRLCAPLDPHPNQ